MSGKRGIIYVVWGNRADGVLERSIASVKRFYPCLPIEVFRVEGDPDSCETLIRKTGMMAMTPFEQTLFLDADTVVMDTLDFGFEKAARFGLACSICECPWAARYAGLGGDTVEYNTGVLFFTRAAEPVFRAWADLAPKLDSSMRLIQNGEQVEMPYNDQASFAKAVEQTGFVPFVLPHNWNFRPQWHRSFFGRIKIWHDYMDPPSSLFAMNDYYRQKGSIIQYHRLS
jgi:hypothetical protein